MNKEGVKNPSEEDSDPMSESRQVLNRNSHEELNKPADDSKNSVEMNNIVPIDIRDDETA
jgi:hypothetical protein